MPELSTLVIKQQLSELLRAPARTTLERESLQAYLPKRRWFAGHDETAGGEVRLLYALPFSEEGDNTILAEVELTIDGQISQYQLPLCFIPEKDPHTPRQEALALARLRRGREVGLFTDALSLPSFTRQIIRNLRNHAVMQWDGSEIQFIGSKQLNQIEDKSSDEVNVLSAEQSNTSVIIGESMVLKVIRRVVQGTHPESEIGGYLTEQGYANIAPMLGEVRRVDKDGQAHTLMILQGFLSNQGDAWQWTQDTLERAIRDQLSGGVSHVENQYTALIELEAFARKLGQRLGEMHLALARESSDPEFGSLPVTTAETDLWAKNISALVRDALDAISTGYVFGTEGTQYSTWLLAHREDVIGLVHKLAAESAGGIRTRVHGDLHLGQILVVGGDAYFIDFEGEPNRSMAERRDRQSPLKDVAGILRSFDYAAAMAIRDAQSTDASPAAEKARRTIAAVYLNQTRNAFQDAYCEAAAGLPHAWNVCNGPDAALALFRIEKAAYEILYEANFRQEWLDVPMQGLMEISQYYLERRND